MADVTATKFPRIVIEYCTQCHWMLRAAWFAQELLSTFSNSIGEVALQPATGGTFNIQLFHAAESSLDGIATIQKHLLWDRKAEGGFPEAKELKRRVRDIIDPNRDLGHVDRKKKPVTEPPVPKSEPAQRSEDPGPFPTTTTATLNTIPQTVSLNQASFNPLGVDVSVDESGSAAATCPPGEECDESDDR